MTPDPLLARLREIQAKYASGEMMSATAEAYEAELRALLADVAIEYALTFSNYRDSDPIFRTMEENIHSRFGVEVKP